MPELPWEQIWVLLKELVAPALAASLVVMLALRLVGGERLAPLAAALAVAAGVFAGNHFRKPMSWKLDEERPLTCSDLRTVLGWSLESKPPAQVGAEGESTEPRDSLEPPPMPAARFWLPWLAALAMVIELVVGLPFVPAGLGWIARAFVAVLASRLLTPAGMRMELPAVSWLLASAIVLEWGVLATLARQWKDGAAATAMALCLSSAGLVLVLQAGSARYMDMAMLFFGALLGPSLLVWKWSGDIAPAVAGAAVFLPGLVLLGYHDAPGDLPPPINNFLLVGLAPLALAPMLLPYVVSRPGWKHWLPGMVLPLIPATLAVVSVLQTESLDF